MIQAASSLPYHLGLERQVRYRVTFSITAAYLVKFTIKYSLPDDSISIFVGLVADLSPQKAVAVREGAAHFEAIS